MGQKVNPHGLRVGVIKDWDSKWYAEKDFADYLVEDHEIRTYLKKRLYSAGVSKIEIERAGVGLIVTFFKGLTFVFTIHGNILLKNCVCSSSGGVACGICQTSRSAHKLQCKCCMFQKVLLIFLYGKIRIFGPYERVLKLSSLLPSPWFW